MIQLLTSKVNSTPSRDNLGYRKEVSRVQSSSNPCILSLWQIPSSDRPFHPPPTFCFRRLKLMFMTGHSNPVVSQKLLISNASMPMTTSLLTTVA